MGLQGVAGWGPHLSSTPRPTWEPPGALHPPPVTQLPTPRGSPPAKWLTCREERPWPPSCSLNITHHHPHTAHSCAPHVREAGLRSPRWGTRRCGEGVTVSYRAGPGGAQVPRSGWHPTGGGTLLPGAAGPSPRAAPQAPPPAAAGPARAPPGPRAGTLVSKPEPLGKSESRPPPRAPQTPPPAPPAGPVPPGAVPGGRRHHHRPGPAPGGPVLLPSPVLAELAGATAPGTCGWDVGPQPGAGFISHPGKGWGWRDRHGARCPPSCPPLPGQASPVNTARATSLAGRGPGPRSRQLADSAPRPPQPPHCPGTPAPPEAPLF